MGRGVFTKVNIPKGRCFLVDHTATTEHDAFPHYLFQHPDDSKGLVGLGMSSLINHSNDPNCFWTYDPDSQTMGFHALRDIEAGEQLFHDYGYDPE